MSPSTSTFAGDQRQNLWLAYSVTLEMWQQSMVRFHVPARWSIVFWHRLQKQAEIAGGFQVAPAAVHSRNILSELGYPQPPTLLRMDNTVAIVIATDTINTKRSKSIDMRFYWLRDRVRHAGQVKVTHIAGQWNIADHFTKPLPKAKLEQFLNYLIVNIDNEEELPEHKTTTITIPIRMWVKGVLYALYYTPYTGLVPNPYIRTITLYVE